MARGTRRSGLGEASRHLGIGVTWMLSAALFTMLGVRLDRRWGTDPALTLAGLIVGGVAGFWYVYRQTVVLPRREQEAAAGGKAGGAADGEGEGERR